MALVGTMRRLCSKSTSEITQGHLEVFSSLVLGFGAVNLMFGVIIPSCRESMTLIKVVIPDAPSEWPPLGFVYYLVTELAPLIIFPLAEPM